MSVEGRYVTILGVWYLFFCSYPGQYNYADEILNSVEKPEEFLLNCLVHLNLIKIFSLCWSKWCSKQCSLKKYLPAISHILNVFFGGKSYYKKKQSRADTAAIFSVLNLSEILFSLDVSSGYPEPGDELWPCYSFFLLLFLPHTIT